jgi:hypothetical protein
VQRLLDVNLVRGAGAADRDLGGVARPVLGLQAMVQLKPCQYSPDLDAGPLPITASRRNTAPDFQIKFSFSPGDSYFSIQSTHFATGSLPHGMIGTEEVEFFGDPSMIRSL